MKFFIKLITFSYTANNTKIGIRLRCITTQHTEDGKMVNIYVVLK